MTREVQFVNNIEAEYLQTTLQVYTATIRKRAERGQILFMIRTDVLSSHYSRRKRRGTRPRSQPSCGRT
jgi:hypothetical protein